MATYKEIKGVTIQTRDSDPNLAGAAGGTWASGGDLNTARNNLKSVGTQTLALAFAGDTGSYSALTEQYNGSSWTEVGDLNTSRQAFYEAGVYNSALASGGEVGGNTANTESWNGTAWTEVNDLNTARRNGGGAGSSNSNALAFGGYTTTPVAVNETWDGSSWTEVGNLNTARYGIAGTGTNTAALAITGHPNRSINESWNGSAWTELNDTNTGRQAAAGAGTTTEGLVFGGAPAIANTEFWNGSSWTEVADLATGRQKLAGNGTSVAGLASGGTSPTTAATEEFTQSSSPVLVEGMIFLSGGTTLKGFGRAAGIPAATWASGGNLNEGRGNAGSSGTQTATLFFGGEPPGGAQSALTEQYDGSSWTEVADLNVARGQQFFSNQGTQTAALSATGVPLQTSVESWNGSSWTETTDLNTARRNGASLGTQGAMLGTGGYNPPSYRTLTEIWDGSSWTETGDCPDAKFVCRGGGGTTTAGIIAGNYPNGDVDSSQTWDGTSWTNGPNINTGRSGIAFSAQTQSSALGHGGGTGTPQAAQTKTEFFNGTSWTELNDLSTASQQGGGAGSSVSGIHMGGYPGVSATEEWTADNTLADVTVS
tara:strand:+ start:187 stop:1977 length:1791 start_codon:yes stop_codon:yes gene_type:complete